MATGPAPPRGSPAPIFLIMTIGRPGSRPIGSPKCASRSASWFYSQLFMSVCLVDKAPFRSVLGYEKMLDEHGRPMHGSWEISSRPRRRSRVWAPTSCAGSTATNHPTATCFSATGRAHEIKRKLLTLWNSVGFLVRYANIEGFRPTLDDLATGPVGIELRPLDRWLIARTEKLVADATAALEEQLTYRLISAFESFVEDLSNWYIRRSRRRFYSYDDAAFRTLWFALVTGLRVVSPVMPFLADHLWRNLVANACEGAPESIFSASWPEVRQPDERLLAEIAEVRRIVELGREARNTAGVKLRQPLRRGVRARRAARWRARG